MQKVANNFGIKITSEGEIVTESNGADFAKNEQFYVCYIVNIGYVKAFK